MPKKLTAKVYKNAKDQWGLQVSMPYEDAKAITEGDKAKKSELVKAIKSAVEAAPTDAK